MNAQARTERKARAHARQQLRIARRAALQHYMDTIDIEVAVYGAHDIPRSLRTAMLASMASHLPADLEVITAPYADQLCCRYRGHFD